MQLPLLYGRVDHGFKDFSNIKHKFKSLLVYWYLCHLAEICAQSHDHFKMVCIALQRYLGVLSDIF